MIITTTATTAAMTTIGDATMATTSTLVGLIARKEFQIDASIIVEAGDDNGVEGFRQP